MANYAVLKAAIADVIKTNGNNEITGQLLQDSLNAMINSLGMGFQSMGVATSETEPGTPDTNVMYIAGAGTYPNFGGTNVPKGSLGIFRYNGEWAYSVLDIASWADASNRLYYNTQAGNVAAKTIQADGFTLQPGGWLKVHFDNANEAANPTLNVNNTGAHTMTFNGRTVSATNSWKTGETVAFYYDNYMLGTWHGIRLVEYPDFVNVNELIGQATPFASASAARTAIPQQNRKAGLNIAYLLSTGEETSQWQLDMFIGDDITDWSVVDNWRVIGPVSVSLNAETGKTELSIGGDVKLAIDKEPVIFSENLITSDALAKVSNKKQYFANDSEVFRITNFEWLDNTYVDVNGELQYIEESTGEYPYHYKSIYKLPVNQWKRIVISNIIAEGNAYVACFDKDEELLSVTHATRSITIDNSNSNICYLSFCANVVYYDGEVTLTVYSKTENNLIQKSNEYLEISIPSEVKYPNFTLGTDNELTYQSGLTCIKDFDISGYKHLVINQNGSGVYTFYLILTDSSNVLHVENITSGTIKYIDNSLGTYKYMSISNKGNGLHIFSDTILLKSAVVNEVNRQDYEEDINTVSESSFESIDISKYVVDNTYIDNSGHIQNIAPASYHYQSVVFLPIKQYRHLMISGAKSGTNAYIALFGADFTVLQTLQGNNIHIDNSSGTYYYMSFGDSIVPRPLWVNAYKNISVATVVKKLSEESDIKVYKELKLNWVDETYIDSNNEQKPVASASTYRFQSILNIDVHDATKIMVDVYAAGNANVVTTDIDGNIIQAVNSILPYEIDNTAGTIYYISISNNLLRYATPSLKIYKKAIVNDFAELAYKHSISLLGKNIAVLGDSIMMLMSGVASDIQSNVVTYVGTDNVTYNLSDLTIIGGLLYVTSTLVNGEVGPNSIQCDVHNTKQSVLNAESWPTLKEKINANYIINTGRGGATIQGGTITTAYPAHGEMAFNTLPNHCLELSRRVNAGEPTPDLIMIWMGTNGFYRFIVDGNWVEPTNFDEIMALDYTTQLLADTDAAMAAKYTFYGGLRFSLEYLYRNFPNANVILFAPIQSSVASRNYERIRKVGGYIRRMAERYAAMFVDACVEMGINDIFDTEDAHVWLYDGLHPNDKGKVLYTNYTAKKLETIYFDKI